MKKKKIIPLVTITLSVLILLSAIFLNLNAREDHLKESNREKQNIEDKNLLEDQTEDKGLLENQTGDKIDKEDTTVTEKDKNVNNDSKINEKSSTNETNNVGDNKTKDNSNSNGNSTIVPEKPNSNNQQDIVEVPNEDTNDKNVSIQNDAEYKKIKEQCEFFTRAECQAASGKVAIKYLEMGNGSVSTSCESFAYKGEIVGYRMKIRFEDGTWIYNK